MDRAARSSCRQVARVGLLAICAGACANPQDPPGGPPDFDAPVILAITPDSGVVVDGLDDALEIQFNEVINERSGSGLENLILISPRHEEVDVSWKRSRITVEPNDGWREGVAYQLTILPGFADLRNNRLDSSRTIIFSTGGPIPNTTINGTVVDWETGQAAPRALVEALLLPDSLVYVAMADSVGDFELTAANPGEYVIYGTVDQNNNLRRDRRESFDSIAVSLDSAVSHILWAFVHDTNGPRIREVTGIDSITLQVDFGQKLAPGEPPESLVSVFSLPDTIPVGVASVWNQETYDSVRSVEAVADSIRLAALTDSLRNAELDSLRLASEAGDTSATAALEATLAAAEDTTVAEGQRDREAEAEAADTLGQGEQLGVDIGDQMPGDSVAADTNRVALLLAERPKLQDSWYVRLVANTIPGARYLITAIAINVSGATNESQGLLILPEPEPADTT